MSPSWMLLMLAGPLIALISTVEAGKQFDGRVRMCPPGGSSFTMAWSMACSMRKKRDVQQQIEGDDIVPEEDGEYQRARRAFIAPSIRQLQRICCNPGCTVSDLLGYCGPLSGW
ncbi:unnamed protein product, partial [Mesorhabditis spiculigera]